MRPTSVGRSPGLRGGRAKGKKALVAVAVELREPRGFGRVRMRVIPDASSATLGAFFSDNVEPGARVITDGWAGYRRIGKLGYVLCQRSCPRYASGALARSLLASMVVSVILSDDAARG